VRGAFERCVELRELACSPRERNLIQPTEREETPVAHGLI